jgi:hypothetical protein
MTRHFTFILSRALACRAFSQRLIFKPKAISGWKIFGMEKWYVENGTLGL